jgi:hypothetical protein
MLATPIVQHGAVKPSSLEQQIYEPDLFASRYTEIPSNMQMRADYDVRTDGQPVYLGFAPKGLLSSLDGWLVHKFTYDVSNRVTVRQIGYGIWDTRTTTITYS